MPDCILKIDNLSFSYHKTKVLSGLSLNIESGEFCTLIGSNGAGKSSLVKLILGELKADCGSISLFGSPLDSFSSWENIGYLPQTTDSAYDHFPANVAEVVCSNLFKSGHWYKPVTKAMNEQVMQALSLVGMQDYSKRLLSELSGGQRQRVLLARALVNLPKLLILDEPTNALDVASSEALMQTLNQIQATKHTTTLMITHDLCCISEASGRLLELEHGQVRDFAQVAHLAGSSCCTSHNAFNAKAPLTQEPLC